MDLSSRERNSFYLSIGVIVLVIIAIAAFIFAGGGYIFYTIAIIAIIAGFYMSYYVSKPERQAKRAKIKK